MSSKTNDPELGDLTKQIAKGGGIYLMGGMIGKVVTFALHILLGRVLGASTYGLYALGFSITGIAISLASLGLQNGIVRFGAIHIGQGNEVRLKRTILTAFTMSMFSSIVIATMLFLLSEPISTRIFKKPELTFVLQIFSISIPFYIFFQMSASTARAFRRMDYDTGLINVLRPLLNFLFVFAAFLLGYRLEGAVMGVLLSAAVSSLIGIYVVVKVFPEIKENIKLNFYDKSLLKFSLVIMFVGLIYFFVLQTDRLMIGYFMATSDLGIYTAASTISLQLMLFTTIFMGIFSPIVSDLSHRQKTEYLNKVLSITTRWSFSFTLPFLLIVLLFPSELLGLFGHEFQTGANILVILSIAQLAITTAGPSGLLLQMSGRQNIVFIDTLITLIMNFSLNYWFIQEYGIFGAAIATSISLIFLSTLIFSQNFLIFKVNPFSRNYLKPIKAGAISSGLFFLVLLLLGESNVLLIPLILLSYMGCMFTMKFDPEDEIIIRAIKIKFLRGKFN